VSSALAAASVGLAVAGCNPQPPGTTASPRAAPSASARVSAPLSSEAGRQVNQILGQFDSTWADGSFPDLDQGYLYAVDARLHAYADASRWALIVETVGYNPRAGNLLDVLYVFSNRLTSGRPGCGNGDFLARVDNFAVVEGELEKYRGGVPVVVRGRPLDVAAPAGTRLVDVFRQLDPAHRELLLADESELRRRIPAGVPEILRLDQWHQPDITNRRPSGTETYRLLAEVLATADPGRYRPTLAPNTHWSNWPDSGSL
jgi:hypothetical protein